MNSVFNLPDGQVMFLRNLNNRMKSILLVKKFLGLVEMMSGLVNASFSLPEWQAIKSDFLCTLGITIICIRHYYAKGAVCMAQDPFLKSGVIFR